MLCKVHLKINNQGNDLRYFNYLFFCKIVFQKNHQIGRGCKVGLFIRQFHCNANCKFQTKAFNMICLDVFSGFSSVES